VSDPEYDRIVRQDLARAAKTERDRAEKAEARVTALEKLVDSHAEVATEMTDERDGYRSALCDLVAATHAYRTLPGVKKAFDKARATLKDGPAKRPSDSVCPPKQEKPK
jgi:hypothetical protein